MRREISYSEFFRPPDILAGLCNQHWQCLLRKKEFDDQTKPSSSQP